MVSLTATCGTTHKPSITKTLSYETELARDLQKVDESCDDNFALLMATEYAEEDQQLNEYGYPMTAREIASSVTRPKKKRDEGQQVFKIGKDSKFFLNSRKATAFDFRCGNLSDSVEVAHIANPTLVYNSALVIDQSRQDGITSGPMAGCKSDDVQNSGKIKYEKQAAVRMMEAAARIVEAANRSQQGKNGTKETYLIKRDVGLDVVLSTVPRTKARVRLCHPSELNSQVKENEKEDLSFSDACETALVHAKEDGSAHKRVDVGIVDSGNNLRHVFRDRRYFPGTLKWKNLKIAGVHGPQVVKVGVGTACFTTMTTSGRKYAWQFPDSLFNPKCEVNLLSVNRFHFTAKDDKEYTGHEVHLIDEAVYLNCGEAVETPRDKKSKLFLMRMQWVKSREKRLFRTLLQNQSKWRSTKAFHALVDAIGEKDDLNMFFSSSHMLKPTSAEIVSEILNHPVAKVLDLTLRHKMIDGIKTAGRLKITDNKYAVVKRRDAYWQGRMTEKHVPGVSRRPPSVEVARGSHITSDIGGPLAVKDRKGNSFYVLFKCMYTQFRRSYRMKKKTEVIDCFLKFLTELQLYEGKDGKAPETRYIVTDHDSQYLSEEFQKFCRNWNEGRLIGKWTCSPHSHNQNPAEREMRTIGEAAISAMFEAGLPPSFVLDAIEDYCEKMNAQFTSVCYNEKHRYHSPHRRMTGQNSHINSLAKFGCRAVVHVTPKERPRKFTQHALSPDYCKGWIGINLGPCQGRLAHKIWRHMEGPKSVYNRYHVLFDSTVCYGDFLGAAFTKLEKGYEENRKYYKSEVLKLYGATSDDLVTNMLKNRSWQSTGPVSERTSWAAEIAAASAASNDPAPVVQPAPQIAAAADAAVAPTARPAAHNPVARAVAAQHPHPPLPPRHDAVDRQGAAQPQMRRQRVEMRRRQAAEPAYLLRRRAYRTPNEVLAQRSRNATLLRGPNTVAEQRARNSRQQRRSLHSNAAADRSTRPPAQTRTSSSNSPRTSAASPRPARARANAARRRAECNHRVTFGDSDRVTLADRQNAPASANEATLRQMRRDRAASSFRTPGTPGAANSADTTQPSQTPTATTRMSRQPSFTPEERSRRTSETETMRRHAISALRGVPTAKDTTALHLVELVNITADFMCALDDAYEEGLHDVRDSFEMYEQSDHAQLWTFQEEFNPDNSCLESLLLDVDGDHAMMLQLCEATRKAIASRKEPTSMKQINDIQDPVEHKLVRDAMLDELLWLVQNKKVLVKKKSDVKQAEGHLPYELDGKWVIKYKKDLQGLLDRVRARWVLRGDLQRAHLDYDPSALYSPVASKSGTFTALILGVQHGLQLWECDSAKAFTVSKADVANLHMRVPAGFRDNESPLCTPHGEDTCFELLTSLYGLRQASAVYYRTVANCLQAYTDKKGQKYRRSDNDPCVFTKGKLPSGLDKDGIPNKGDYITFSMHVDDQFVACSTTAHKDELCEVMKKGGFDVQAKMMEQCLGVAMKYIQFNGKPNTGTLQFSHDVYINKCFDEAKVHFDNSTHGVVATPLNETKWKQRSTEVVEPVVFDKARYKVFRRILGQVAHCSHFSHPEITTAVNLVSQYMANPSPHDLESVWHILKYLKGTVNKERSQLTFKINLEAYKTKANPLHILCDANLEVKNSRSGFAAYLYGNLVGWVSKRQNMVSLSTCESEYVALTTCAQFAKWYRALACSMGVEQVGCEPAIILTDSTSAKQLAESPISIINTKSRHIERRVHWIRDEIRDKNILLHHVDGLKNTADLFTKIQGKKLFHECRDRLLLGDFRNIDDISNNTEAHAHYVDVAYDSECYKIYWINLPPSIELTPKKTNGELQQKKHRQKHRHKRRKWHAAEKKKRQKTTDAEDKSDAEE